jgi:hypothetical protein
VTRGRISVSLGGLALAAAPLLLLVGCGRSELLPPLGPGAGGLDAAGEPAPHGGDARDGRAPCPTICAPGQTCTPDLFNSARATTTEDALVVALADLNRDGRLDLVSLTQTDLRVALGRGDGSFAPSQGVPSMALLSDFAVGDLDRDGVPDLVVVTRDAAEVEVHLGAADGTFRAAGSFPQPLNRGRHARPSGRDQMSSSPDEHAPERRRPSQVLGAGAGGSAAPGLQIAQAMRIKVGAILLSVWSVLNLVVAVIVTAATLAGRRAVILQLLFDGAQLPTMDPRLVAVINAQAVLANPTIAALCVIVLALIWTSVVKQARWAFWTLAGTLLPLQIFAYLSDRFLANHNLTANAVSSILLVAGLVLVRPQSGMVARGTGY